MYTLGKGAGKGQHARDAICGRFVTVFGGFTDYIDKRRTHHRAIGDRGNRVSLFGRANTETYGHRQVCATFDARNIF